MWRVTTCVWAFCERLTTTSRIVLCSLSRRLFVIFSGIGCFSSFNLWTALDEFFDVFECRYLNAIQTNAHHLLRYLAAAVIVNKRRRNMLKELIKVIQQEHYTYRDPITEFLECLYVNYDFEGAQQKLRECEEVSSSSIDVFSFSDKFLSCERCVPVMILEGCPRQGLLCLRVLCQLFPSFIWKNMLSCYSDLNLMVECLLCSWSWTTFSWESNHKRMALSQFLWGMSSWRMQGYSSSRHTAGYTSVSTSGNCISLDQSEWLVRLLVDCHGFVGRCARWIDVVYQRCMMESST